MPPKKEKRAQTWTDSERETVIHTLAGYLRNNPGETLPFAWRQCCHCLPADRRLLESHRGTAAFRPLIPAIKDAMQAKAEAPLPQVVEKVVEHVRPLVDVETADLQAELWRRNLEPVVPVLADTIAQQVASLVAAHLAPKKAGDTKSGRQRLRRVMVMGMKRSTEVLMQEEFVGLLEIRAFQDESTAKLKSTIQWADEVILMTKFINHSEVAVVRRMRERFAYCNGGATDLMGMLQDLVEKATT